MFLNILHLANIYTIKLWAISMTILSKILHILNQGKLLLPSAKGKIQALKQYKIALVTKG